VANIVFAALEALEVNTCQKFQSVVQTYAT
jgi:hypothetical protein